MRVQGWDPVLLICQIISLQTIHYLTLSILTPPLLSFTQPALLSYSGGSSTVGHILDWREMASRPTIPSSSFQGLLEFSPSGSWSKLRGAWAGGKHVGEVVGEPLAENEGKEGKPEMKGGDLGVDGTRSWLIAFAWVVASVIDIAPLYYLIRRPTYILDFSLTLTFVHLILTSYYAKSFPTSFFWWLIMAISAVIMIVVAEQLCVKREMRTDLNMGWTADATSGDEIELGHVART